MNGYLTSSCESCPYWRNTEKEWGCACPFPIMECPPYAEEWNKKNEQNQDE